MLMFKHLLFIYCDKQGNITQASNPNGTVEKTTSDKSLFLLKAKSTLIITYTWVARLIRRVRLTVVFLAACSGFNII